MSERAPPSLAQWRALGARVELNGRQVFAIEAGSGPTLLCIHGFPTSSWDFRHLWSALTRQFRVIAIDMLGFGDSDKPPGHVYRITEQADLQQAALAHFGISQFHVLAHDYGVSVAQELLARQRSSDVSVSTKLQSVCFMNGGLIPEMHRPLAVQRLLASRLGPLMAHFLGKRAFERSLRRVFAPATPPSQEELDGFWALFHQRGGKRALPRLIGYMHERVMHRDRWVGALREPPCPLGFICGALDPISGAHLAQFLMHEMPHIRSTLLPRAGHYPQVEDPPAVLGAFLSFQTEIAASR